MRPPPQLAASSSLFHRSGRSASAGLQSGACGRVYECGTSGRELILHAPNQHLALVPVPT